MTDTIVVPGGIDMGFKIVERENGNMSAISLCPSGSKLIEVAWDMCAGCSQHLSNCVHDVPIEPNYIRNWRLGLEPATAVYGPKSGNDSHKSFGGPISTPKSNPLNVLDLVDDEMVAAIKAEQESREQ